jgi:hypothetical protein
MARRTGLQRATVGSIVDEQLEFLIGIRQQLRSLTSQVGVLIERQQALLAEPPASERTTKRKTFGGDDGEKGSGPDTTG